MLDFESGSSIHPSATGIRSGVAAREAFALRLKQVAKRNGSQIAVLASPAHSTWGMLSGIHAGILVDSARAFADLKRIPPFDIAV